LGWGNPVESVHFSKLVIPLSRNLFYYIDVIEQGGAKLVIPVLRMDSIACANLVSGRLYCGENHLTSKKVFARLFRGCWSFLVSGAEAEPGVSF
jgi:hypothetical protein